VGIVALLRTLRIHGHAVLRPAGIRVRAIPVLDPFPRVTRHVEEPIAVRRKASDGTRGEIAVRRGVDDRERSLPDVRARLRRRRTPSRTARLPALRARHIPTPLRSAIFCPPTDRIPSRRTTIPEPQGACPCRRGRCRGPLDGATVRQASIATRRGCLWTA